MTWESGLDESAVEAWLRDSAPDTWAALVGERQRWSSRFRSPAGFQPPPKLLQDRPDMTSPCRRRRLSPLLLAAVALWAALAAGAAAQGNAATDRAALESLYDATDGPNWSQNTNWKTEAPLDQWYGVTTNAAGRVTGLQLNGNGLTGRIPGVIGNLTGLERLDLSTSWYGHQPPPYLPNRLPGPLPPEISRLTNLEILDLTNVGLSGPVPPAVGSLTKLRGVFVDRNKLQGPIPEEFRELENLAVLQASYNDLTGQVSDMLERMPNLRTLTVAYNWGITGPLPPRDEAPRLHRVALMGTQACISDEWLHDMEATHWLGRSCTTPADPIIDIAVFYTVRAREADGGKAAIEATIDLLIAETNQAYAESGVNSRLHLVERTEVDYTSSGNFGTDWRRLLNPSDGYLDGIHRTRDEVGADLVHFITGMPEYDGLGDRPGAFSMVTLRTTVSGALVFAHELGHNFGLIHDRYQVEHNERVSVGAHPGYGYVNARGLGAGSPESRRWRTVMAYSTQCSDAGIRCTRLMRFSNPRQSLGGDPLGVPYGTDSFKVTGSADAVAFMNATGPAVALWRDHVTRQNRPPVAVGALPDRRLAVRDTADVDVSSAFVDPDIGDVLTYTVSSSAPQVVTVRTSGAQVTLTGLGEGTAAIRVTATDPGRLSATQTFTVTVTANRPPEPVGVLPPLTIGLDEAVVSVELSGAFRDPDGDVLTYGAVSSSPAVASVAVLGSTVTVTPLSEGMSTVTVTATDAGGSNGTATQPFAVTVGPAANRRPEAVGALVPLTLGVDDAAATVEVGGAFRDPDGDALTYRATSSAPSVASVAVVGSTVTVAPVSEGTATATVTATDAGGSNGTATQTFSVTVGPAANRPPVAVGTLPAVRLPDLDATLEVDVFGAFDDPDGDALTYAVSSSAPQVVTVRALGARVTLTGVGEGAATVQVTATDPGGLSATQSFAVTVERANQPPEAMGRLPDVVLPDVDATREVDVSRAFTDPDGDALTYAVSSSSPAVVTVRALGARVTLTGVALGRAAIEVTANDPDGQSASQTFAVRVTAPFTDDPIVPGVTPVRAVHFTELRARIDILRREVGLAPFRWTDPVLTAGVTRVRLAHLLELRAALAEAYGAAGRAAPRWTDAPPAAGSTPIRAAHVTELRGAVLALE